MSMTNPNHHTNSITGHRVINIVILLTIITLMSGCSSIPTQKFDAKYGTKLNINHACSIAYHKPDWYQNMQYTYKKWGIPVHVQMAIIHQESKFKGDARPPRKKLFGFLPGPRPSTAFGYAQALDGTWKHYQKQTKNYGADRDDFEDAVDFIGWYTNISHKKLRISKWSAREQYLAYHEGHGGYKRKTYRKKKWLVKVAKKVGNNASKYSKQLAQCKIKPKQNFLSRLF